MPNSYSNSYSGRIHWFYNNSEQLLFQLDTGYLFILKKDPFDTLLTTDMYEGVLQSAVAAGRSVRVSTPSSDSGRVLSITLGG